MLVIQLHIFLLHCNTTTITFYSYFIQFFYSINNLSWPTNDLEVKLRRVELYIMTQVPGFHGNNQHQLLKRSTK